VCEQSVHTEHQHPVFKKPIDENIKIWRYMSFAKYVSLLDRKALYFTRVDRLEDKFEATLPKHIFDPLLEAQVTREQRQTLETNKENILWYNELLKKHTVVNCWHINEYESDAMWKLYLKGEEGIAIQSTYRRLSDSFRNYNENDVFIGVISYIEHEKDVIPWNNAYEPFVYKNRSFEHEKELRVLLSKNIRVELAKNNGLPLGNLEFPANGIEAQIDLENLIEKVVISPKTEKWFEELVRSVTSKYGLDKTVTKSSLATQRGKRN
jgi:hypothetical protein